MALIGHALHFSYRDILDMDTKDFMFFIDECEEYIKSSGF